jgi:hypothetical protein
MKILVCGHNQSLAFNLLSNIQCKYKIIGHTISCMTNDMQCMTNDINFNKQLIMFAKISSQKVIPQAINIYTHTPWSASLEILESATDEEKTVISTYFSILGWKPDIIIHLFDSIPHILDNLMDNDNPDDIKIFKLNGNEPKLAENLMLILDVILMHYPKKMLLTA